MNFGNGTNRPSVLQWLLQYVLRRMRSDVRGVLALVLFLGSFVLAGMLPRVGYILLAVIGIVLSGLMFRANFRNTAP